MKKLSREQMKRVVGGLAQEPGAQFCCVHNADWSRLDCANTSLDNIKDYFYGRANDGLYSNYCCASCGSSYQNATGTTFPGSNS